MALIASADHGHAHDPDGPYGFDPAAAAYDARVQEILARTGSTSRRSASSSSRRRRPTRCGSCSCSRAPSGEDARADLLAYAAPTYYGMLCAELTPA